MKRKRTKRRSALISGLDRLVFEIRKRPTPRLLCVCWNPIPLETEHVDRDRLDLRFCVTCPTCGRVYTGWVATAWNMIAR